MTLDSVTLRVLEIGGGVGWQEEGLDEETVSEAWPESWKESK